MGYNPLTKLPGNLFIEKEFKSRLNKKGFFAFCYLGFTEKCKSSLKYGQKNDTIGH